MKTMTYAQFAEALKDNEVEFGYHGTRTLQLLEGDENNLPRLRCGWQRRIYIPATAEEVKSMPAEHRERFKAPQSHERDQTWHAWGHGVEMHWMVLCNFRRYGWCFCRNFEGEYGYGGSGIYANGIDGGLPCDSEEQVIRETLVRTLAEMKAAGCPQQLLYGAKSRVLLDKLLQDALEHMSHHATACIQSTNGTIDDEVQVVTAV